MSLAEEIRSLRSEAKRLNKENKRLQDERDFSNEARAVLQPRQKKYGLHDRTAENNDMALLHELLE